MEGFEGAVCGFCGVRQKAFSTQSRSYQVPDDCNLKTFKASSSMSRHHQQQKDLKETTTATFLSIN